ncbi:hydrogenase nickel incorporation protein HypB [Youngiibacter fragilis]|jgi:hydrogenase nickel incorporation protein HypB|uniref:Hydrogenase nickel incorporation protein HypB n=1 Tax=Youngiibacter fragilis 232.1 TaxID=994573 RepID=V7I100_9CLOT|nr:hydrogenase nickel incorporation protein HypB [Youngiibacter fragilis]ETA78966.1 hydrogenase nickel incorporation protein HypB [Youngiibacter fragilis 232.1]
MDEIRLIDIRETILTVNGDEAEKVRERLGKDRVFMLNLMSSPGSGKTSIIVGTMKRLRDRYRIGVIEGDIDSMVDSEKIVSEGGYAVQLRTGGDCHLDASMVSSALDTMEVRDFDVIFVENIGNLVCPAEFDIGESLKAMILSVPEGDDKILKYPNMFRVCDVLLVNKVDAAGYFDFDFEALESRVRVLNPQMRVFRVSARTGEGLDEWCTYIEEKITAYREKTDTL